MAGGALVRMVLAPVLGFGTYWSVALIDATAGLAAGAAVMLALALLPGTGRRRTTTFTQA